jgi:lipopolysaccharide transport system ATP-binding protein
MGEVSKGDGRTVLFVSHNMAAVQSLCNKGIVLNYGKLIMNSNVSDALNYYLTSNNPLASSYANVLKANKAGAFVSIKLFSEDNINVNTFVADTKPYIEVEYTLNTDCYNFNSSILVKDSFETHIYSSADTDFDDSLLKRPKGNYKAIIPLDIQFFNTGNYKLEFLMGIINIDLFDKVEMYFSVENNNYLNTGLRPGLLLKTNPWVTSNLAH